MAKAHIIDPYKYIYMQDDKGNVVKEADFYKNVFMLQDDVWGSPDVNDDPLIGGWRPLPTFCECGTEKVHGVVEPSLHSDWCPIYKKFNSGGNNGSECPPSP